jgi:dinuclear metal center YbgI/SA1388 family protein
MRCSTMMERLEVLSPTEMAQDWDNVGLLAGRTEKEIRSVYLAVDATDEVISDAIKTGADMLITHHPLIFKPVKKINNGDYIGRRILKLVQQDICYYAMHTNFDVMGMSDATADEMQLRDRIVLDITYEDEISKEGEGRIGRLPRIMSLIECAAFVKKNFHIESVKVFGDPEMTLERVAIVAGSGKDYIGMAVKAGVDCLITGDIDHHSGIDAVEQGLSIIDAGHYGLEKLFIPYMAEFFRRELPEVKVITAAFKNPFWVL